MEQMNNATQAGTPLVSTASSSGAAVNNELSPDSTNSEMNVESPANLKSGSGLRTYSELREKKRKAEALQNGKQQISSSGEREKVGQGEKLVSPDQRRRTCSVSGCGPSLLENIKVYVRLKPFPKGIKLTKDQKLLYQVINPALFINLRDVKQDMSKNVDVVGKKFIFSEAFGGDVNEVKLFQRVVEPLMERLLAGMNCTIMTYGAAESGKSYTLDGSHANPGLIPKTLERIFSLDKPTSTPNYRPKDNSIECLTATARVLELESRKTLLSSLSRKGTNSYAKVIQAFQEVCQLTALNKPVIHYEVWLSFAEIQDETYYDLLSPAYQKNRSALKMHTDDEGKAFIKDLTHLSVGSASEAWHVLTLGRINLMRGNLMSNTKIPKSHCIFNITLLKYREVNNPESVQMSRFSFCDLAAQESPDIDTSLLALIRCLKATNETHRRESQSKHIEYFCHSKLTHLFDDALTGKEPLSLIINVDPNPGMYRETQAVLHSTALTHEILTKIRNNNSSKVTTSFGKIAVTSPPTVTDWDHLTADTLMALNADFQNEMASLKALNLRGDVQIRKTMVKRYSLMIERIENSYRRRLDVSSAHAKNKKKKDNSEEPQANPMNAPVSEDVEALRAILDTLRSHKQLFERDLIGCQSQLNEVPQPLRETYDELMYSQDPHLRLVDVAMELKNEKGKNDTLNKLLNEARDELIRVLNESCEDKRKIGEIERKYVALKVDRDNELTQRQSMNYSFKRQLEIIVDLERQLEKKMKLVEKVQIKCKVYESEKEASTEVDVEEKEQPMETEDTDVSTVLHTSTEDTVSTAIVNGTATVVPKVPIVTVCETEIIPVESQNQSQIISKIPTVTASKTKIIEASETHIITPAQIQDVKASGIEMIATFADEVASVSENQALPETSAVVSTKTEISVLSELSNSTSKTEILAIPEAELVVPEIQMLSLPEATITLPEPQIILPSLQPETIEILATKDVLPENHLCNMTETPLQIQSHDDKASVFIEEESKDGLKEQIKSLTTSPPPLPEIDACNSCTSDDSIIIEVPSKFAPSGGSPSMNAQVIEDEASTAKGSQTKSVRRSNRRKRSADPSNLTSGKHAKVDVPSIPIITCDICCSQIANENRYHCKICSDGDYDLCQPCFINAGHVHEVEILWTPVHAHHS